MQIYANGSCVRGLVRWQSLRWWRYSKPDQAWCISNFPTISKPFQPFQPKIFLISYTFQPICPNFLHITTICPISLHIPNEKTNILLTDKKTNSSHFFSPPLTTSTNFFLFFFFYLFLQKNKKTKTKPPLSYLSKPFTPFTLFRLFRPVTPF